MNDLMKDAAVATAPQWAATLPLVLFVAFFVAVVVWTYTRAPSRAPEME